MIKNIVFDIGNVLMDYNPDRYMDDLGFDQITKDAVSSAMFCNPLWDESDRGVLTSEQLLSGFIANNPAFESAIRQAYTSVGDTVTLMPYTLPWIESLKSRGYRLYILSNYADRTYQLSQHKMAFLPYMDGVVFSYRCHLIKPQQEIYRHLCTTHSLNPSETVFLDDRSENVDGAQKYGLHSIHFQNYSQASQELESLLHV